MDKRRGSGDLWLKPKLEFYSCFMNVLKNALQNQCVDPLYEVLTRLQIKRGHAGPDSGLCVFLVVWLKDTLWVNIFFFLRYVKNIQILPYTCMFCQL